MKVCLEWVQVYCLTGTHYGSVGLAGKYLAGSVGFGGRGLQKVNYDRLLSEAKSYRATANLQKTKLKSLSTLRHGFKEAGLLRLHQEVWQHEWVRLMSESRRLELEADDRRANALIAATEGRGRESEVKGGVKGDWAVEITRYLAELYQDSRKRQEQDMLLNVRLFRVDLKNWIRLSASPEAERGNAPQWAELQERLGTIKQELEGSQDMLIKEGVALWTDIKQFQDSSCNVAGERGVVAGDIGEVGVAGEVGVTRKVGVAGEVGVAGDTVGVVKHVPPGIQSLTCSDAALKASLMKEFDSLDQHYQAILQQLAGSHTQAIR
jgi:hypothetical protein